ncbi:MAG: Mrp/NBP35 family ATP-binding protein [Desulfurococcaceae archaeon]
MGEKKVKFVPVFDLVNEAKKKLDKFKYKILVMSGKGGVGKSFISSMLALGLAMRGKNVSIFDTDIHGSSIPLFLGIQGSRHYANEAGEILPVEGPLNVKVVAINLMLDSPDTPVVWRGPLVGRAILELAAKVAWYEADYLIVDMPPGTGDVAITVSQVFPSITGAILVTSPNTLTETIVAKAANFMASTGIRLLGVIENMSYFKCPHCGMVTNIMGEMSSDYFFAKYGVNLLGKIPIDPSINEALNKGKPYLLFNRESEAARAILEIVDKVINLVENTNNK